MRIAIVTDAWSPQVNGVVRTLESVTGELRRRGHQIEIISPDQFRSVPCPSYAEIRLSLTGSRGVGRRLEAFSPDAVHIATEGPLGLAGRRWCVQRAWPFTTAFHTQFPDYVAARTGLPVDWSWRYLRWFHQPASAVLAATPALRRTLAERGIAHSVPWGRGVDHRLFRPDASAPALFAHLPRPILLYVGRVAVEKNLDAFLGGRHPGSRIVVGDGPARAALAARYPEAHFLGPLEGEALAGAYAGADAFVFPSLTDTFGLVMIEALSCGTPVAAFPVAGPLDVLDQTVAAMDDDLDHAIAAALMRPRQTCAAYGLRFGWDVSADQFFDALAIRHAVSRAA